MTHWTNTLRTRFAALSHAAMPSALLGACGLAAALAALPGIAEAQKFPSIQPRHDAAVTYDLTSSETGPVHLRAFVSPELQMMRLQEGDGGDYLLLDRGHERVMLVSPDKHLVFAVSSSGFLHRDLGPGSNLQFRPRGHRMVAGHRCMEWSVLGPDGHGNACITRDGLLLAGEGQGNAPDSSGQIPSGRLTAVSVSYDTVPPDVFAIPPGLQEVDLPPKLFAALIPGLSGVPIQ